jgi:hypothetical protein
MPQALLFALRLDQTLIDKTFKEAARVRPPFRVNP